VEEAVYQFLLHVQNLMDRETGLWFHGWSYEGNHNFAHARWARGNSWLTIDPGFPGAGGFTGKQRYAVIWCRC
jgi:hypothetical protein